MKECRVCKKAITRPAGYSDLQWLKREYCSVTCLGVSRQGETHSHYKARKDASSWLVVVCRCGKEFQERESTIKAGRGKYCSKECVYKYGILKGKGHPNWKDNVGYAALHGWVKRRLGRPMKCEFCGFKSTDPRKIHWANKSQKYRRDLTDWLRLCVKCHHGYDDIHAKIWKKRRLVKDA